MINVPCKKCVSPDIRKNGRTKAGAWKYHCKFCGFYGTIGSREEKQKRKEALIEKPLCERVSQQCGLLFMTKRINNGSGSLLIRIPNK
jgi:phage-related protein